MGAKMWHAGGTEAAGAWKRARRRPEWSGAGRSWRSSVQGLAVSSGGKRGEPFAIAARRPAAYPTGRLIRNEPQLEDFHLAQRCLDGDEAALAWLGAQLNGTVCSYLIRAGANLPEAEEVSQKLLTELVAPATGRPPKLLCYRGHAALPTWLNTVALNRWLTRKRAQERWQKLIPATLQAATDNGDAGSDGAVGMNHPSSSSEADDAPLLRVMREAIEAAFSACAPEDFVLLQLAHCDGLRLRELGVMFSCDQSVISRRLKHAQKVIADTTLTHIRRTDPWLELKWDDFTQLCRSATPTCFGLD